MLALQKACTSLPVTQAPVSLTLNVFLGLMCHQVVSELPLLQKNGMGWGRLRWCLSYLLLPKVVMGLFLNMGEEVFIVPGPR